MESSFWSINAGQLVIAMGMLGGFILWFSRFEGRVNATARNVSTLTDQTAKTFVEQRNLISELLARVNQIDREGTRKSQQAIIADEKLAEIALKRIDKLENITIELSPKVAEISANMQWIVHHVQKNGSAKL